jgi:mannose-6-phosphate isomerase-like protein (cupin superfamily)
VRRVVTGIDENGKAVFVSDGEAEQASTGRVLLWGWESTPEVPTDGRKPPYRSFFPPPGGLRTIVVNIPPENAPRAPVMEDEDHVGLYTDAEWDPGNPGMHRSNTVDVGVVLDGSIVVELDGGAQTELHAGDCYVMNGTRHKWRNPNEQPCRILIALWGTEGPAVSGA